MSEDKAALKKLREAIQKVAKVQQGAKEAVTK